MKPSTLRRLMNIWSPFRSPGIRVTHWSDDWREVRVELRQRRFNMNFVGTHYGGSLFSMTDPFWMLILLHVLGRDYLVWDKTSEIDFVKPGKGTVSARFRLHQSVLDDIIAATASVKNAFNGQPEIKSPPSSMNGTVAIAPMTSSRPTVRLCAPLPIADGLARLIARIIAKSGITIRPALNSAG